MQIGAIATLIFTILTTANVYTYNCTMNFSNDNQQGNPVYPVQPVPQGYPPQQGGYPPQNPVMVQPGMQAPNPQAFVQHATAVPQVEHSKKIPDRKSIATKMIELVYLLLIILESVLGLRFIFRLLGANPDNPFIQFLYQATLVFTYPFTTLFQSPIQNNISVSMYRLEFTTLVAMGVYALIAFIVVRIIDVFR